jgi:hypothetical protein
VTEIDVLVAGVMVSGNGLTGAGVSALVAFTVVAVALDPVSSLFCPIK